jgi:alpha-beta hydrolase superfamily lysophospholipase
LLSATRGLSFPDNPPSMGKGMPIFQENELSSGGLRLWWGMSLPGERVRAEVVLTHGLGEHAGRYEHVAACLGEAGIRVIAYDLRGHGRSGGPRGDAPAYDALLDDLDRVLTVCPRGEGPIFLMGHSLGGQITLKYLLERRPAVRGAVIASPWLRLAFMPSRWRLFLGQLAMRIYPAFSQRTPGDSMRLSRDREHLASLSAPELLHHRISTRLFFAIQQAGRDLLRLAPKLELPILLLHGEADEVTSPKATEEFFGRAKSEDKRLVLVPDALHETHNDLCRDHVLSEILGWLRGRVA